MVLPNAANMVVSRLKILDYLLSEAHPDGRSKARFFASLGFSRQEWQLLATALRNHALSHPVVTAVETGFGVRYVIEGGLESPDARVPSVRTVWLIRTGGEIPELVMAYPIRARSQHDS